jgi:hypothetical protein
MSQSEKRGRVLDPRQYARLAEKKTNSFSLAIGCQSLNRSSEQEGLSRLTDSRDGIITSLRGLPQWHLFYRGEVIMPF